MCICMYIYVNIHIYTAISEHAGVFFCERPPTELAAASLNGYLGHVKELRLCRPSPVDTRELL